MALGRIVIGVSQTGQWHVLDRQKRSKKFVLVHPSIPSSEQRFERSYTLETDLNEAIRKIETDGYHARMRNLDNDSPDDIIQNKRMRLIEVPE
jgi:hypothetical protein